MKHFKYIIIILLMNGCTIPSSNKDDIKAVIIAMENQAMEQWNKGNPDGFIALYADDVVYIDPFMDKWIEGKKALEEYYNSFRGEVKADSWEIKNPVVQVSSEIAVLSYSYEAHTNDEFIKMNCTEVYRLNSSKQWKIIHNHWSFTQPNITQ